MSGHDDGLVLGPGPMLPSTPLGFWMALMLFGVCVCVMWWLLWPAGRFVAWAIVTGLMVATTFITFPDAAQALFGEADWPTWVAAAAVVVMMASSLRATPSTLSAAASATATHEAEGADPAVAGHQTPLAPTEPSTWLSGKGINHAAH